MAITRQDETELITTVYEGILEDPHWTTFLRRLRGRLRGDNVDLLVARTGTLDIAATGYGFKESRLIEDYRRAPAPFQLIRPNRAYAEDELVALFPTDDADLEQKRRLVRVTDDLGTSAWLEVSRKARAFGAVDGALLTQIAPHLAIALRTLTTLRRAAQREEAASRGLGRAGVGWIRLDRRGYAIDWNDEANRILRTITPQWRARDGQLRLGLQTADRLIAQFFAGFATGKSDKPLVIRLSARPVVDIVLSAAASEATTVAYVRSPTRRDVETDARALMPLFGLPLSEARLAARLAAGETIAEAATDLNLTIETARNYSKRLYAKTGTRGHADLVRVILESIVAFA